MTSSACLQTIPGHAMMVFCVQLHDQQLVTGSDSDFLTSWDIGSGEKIHEFHGHQDAILCVQLEAERIVTGSFDTNVKVWKVNE